MKTDLFLNATALSKLACDRHYQLNCQWGYGDFSNDYASFGTDFHSYAEYSAKAGPKADFIDYFTANPGLSKQLQKICVYYQQLNPFTGNEIIYDSKGIPGVEYKFCFPILEDNDYRILLAGTIDRIDREDNQLRVIDHKTARNVKIRDVLAEYEMHIQVPLYLWVLKRYLAADFPKNIQDELAAGNIHGRYHGIFISFDPVKFELSNMITLTADMEANLERMVNQAAARMVAIHKLGDQLALPTGMSHKVCKNCSFKNLCITRNDADIYRALQSRTPKPYDPRTWR
jgi:ATP-dependent nuclease, subunit B